MSRGKKDRPNINDFPADLRLMIYAAIQAGQTDLASELIGNYLEKTKVKENEHRRNT